MSSVALLHRQWDWWFDGAVKRGASAAEYAKSVKHLGSFATVQDFWRYWNNFDTSKFPAFSNLRLFQRGVPPKWEHPENSRGGKWMVNVPKSASARIYLELLLSVLGEEFPHSEFLCGVVLSIRPRSDCVSLWNNSHTTSKARADISAAIIRFFPADAQINYAMHNPDLANAPEPEPKPLPKPIAAPKTPKPASSASSSSSSSSTATSTSKSTKSTPTVHRRSISYSGPSRRMRKRSVDWTPDRSPSPTVGTFKERLALKSSPRSPSPRSPAVQTTTNNNKANKNNTNNTTNNDDEDNDISDSLNKNSASPAPSELEIFEPADSDSDSESLSIPARRRPALAADGRFRWRRFEEQLESTNGDAALRRRAQRRSSGAAAVPKTAIITEEAPAPHTTVIKITTSNRTVIVALLVVLSVLVFLLIALLLLK